MQEKYKDYVLYELNSVDTLDLRWSLLDLVSCY